VFMPAFAQAIGITSGGATDLIVQLVAFALILGLMYLLILRLQQKQARQFADLIAAASMAPRSKEAGAANSAALDSDKNDSDSLSKLGNATAEAGSDIESLMSAVGDQAVELRGQHAKAVSNLSLGFDVLTNRLSTIHPLLGKVMEAASKSENTVGLLTASNEDYKRKLSEVERELMHFRPLAIKLEEDYRSARNQLAESNRRYLALETEHAEAQGTINDLFQKLASAEMARQRAVEENAAFIQKLNEHDSTIQSMLRETAHLKSEGVSVTSDLQQAERELRSLSDKYAVELEENSRAKAALNSLQVQFNQFRKESASQIEQVQDRERVLIEALSIKEKQFYESDIKRSALESKVDFLTRTNQRLRDELHRQLDHIGNLEASNRNLLDALARNSASAEQENEIKDSTKTTRVAPKLRAVPDSQMGNGAPAKSLPPEPE
jgi:chromosome segregation ATPase